MLILYLLSVVSFLALVWAAIAITRHIRSAARQTAVSDSLDQRAGPSTNGAITLAGARRDPVATRAHNDWENLTNSIGKHDLGNTNYPRAVNRITTPARAGKRIA